MISVRKAKTVCICAAFYASLSAASVPEGALEPEETADYSRFNIGASAVLTLPQGGTHGMRRLGGAALRGGMYCSEFFAVECEASWLENASGFAAQGLWHWQGADLYGRLFGYSVFDPFFTFGARGWLGHGIGQVGPKIGTGAFWHLTEEWSLRAEADMSLCLDSDEDAVFTVCVGVQRWF